MAVMKAAATVAMTEIKRTKKVVITSSVAAIGLGHTDKMTFNEADWSKMDGLNAYCKSKMLAEKATWDFLKELPADEKFDLVTINPGLLIGPNLNEA